MATSSDSATPCWKFFGRKEQFPVLKIHLEGDMNVVGIGYLWNGHELARMVTAPVLAAPPDGYNAAERRRFNETELVRYKIESEKVSSNVRKIDTERHKEREPLRQWCERNDPHYQEVEYLEAT
jgi:hypothetical protein